MGAIPKLRRIVLYKPSSGVLPHDYGNPQPDGPRGPRARTWLQGWLNNSKEAATCGMNYHLVMTNIAIENGHL